VTKGKVRKIHTAYGEQEERKNARFYKNCKNDSRYAYTCNGNASLLSDFET
jgi:hypothetical protein